MIAEPYVIGGIPVDSSCSFLIIMSDGLYHSLQHATGTDRVNSEISSLVATEFAVQNTLNGVAQALVDKVVRIHHDSFMMGNQEVKLRCHKRGDITLLVRNFNYLLPNAIGTPTGGVRSLPVSVPYYTGRPSMPPTVTIPEPAPTDKDGTEELATPVASTSPSSTQYSSNLDTNITNDSRTSTGTYSTTNSTQSSEDTRFPSRFYQREKLVLDEDGRVEAYVDFSDFYRAIEAMTESQRETLNAETKPKSGYEPIAEESDTSLMSVGSTTTDTSGAGSDASASTSQSASTSEA